MRESLVLFESVINSRWFIRTSIILFLNKIDVFKTKLPKVRCCFRHILFHLCSHAWQVPLARFFEEYTGGSDVNKAAKYILWKFMQANRARLSVYPQYDTSDHRFDFCLCNCLLAWHKPQIPRISGWCLQPLRKQYFQMHSKIPVSYSLSNLELSSPVVVRLSCYHLHSTAWRELSGSIILQCLKLNPYCSSCVVVFCIYHPWFLTFSRMHLTFLSLSPIFPVLIIICEISSHLSSIQLRSSSKILIDFSGNFNADPETSDLIHFIFFFPSHNCQGLGLTGDRMGIFFWIGFSTFQVMQPCPNWTICQWWFDVDGGFVSPFFYFYLPPLSLPCSLFLYSFFL